MDKKQLGVLGTCAGVVSTLAAVGVFTLGGNNPSPVEHGTVPAGQLTTSEPSSTESSTAPTPAAAEPLEAKVPAEPVDQPAPAEPVAPPAVDEPAIPPPAEPLPLDTTAPQPPQTVRCWMDGSDPVNFPNGREICEPA